MTLLGYGDDDTFKACAWLLQNELIESDHMKTSNLDVADAVRISSSGFMHLRVLTERIEYVTGVLPSTPIFDQKFATTVADRVKVENERGSVPSHMKSELARGFYNYLTEQARQVSTVVPNFVGDHGGVGYILNQLQTAMTFHANLRDRSGPNELDY